jgi:O-antigen ligase
MSSFVSVLSTVSESGFKWVKSNLAVVLLITTLFLFISKSLYNIPVGIMAVLGAWRILRYPKQIWRDPYSRTYIILFFCLWIPLLLSFIDSVNLRRSAETLFPYLRFLFFGIYILYEIRKSDVLEKITTAVFILTAFWCIDAVIQLMLKVDLFGYPYKPGDITGMFYPRNTIAHVTACLSPFYFEAIRKRSDQLKWLWLLILPLFIVILASGRRATWIMLMVSIVGYMFYLFKMPGSKPLSVKKLIPLAAITIATIVFIISTNSPLRDRLEDSMGLFSGDYEQINVATARRLPIWNTAIAMFRDNWINGIGPRSYRFAYKRYSEPDDYWVNRGGIHPTTHPHQIILEVLTETGVIGAVGVVLFVYIFYKLVRSKQLFFRVFPSLLAIFIAVFPINTHMAFYGSYWASMFWWLMVMAFLACSLSGATESG